MKTNIFDDLWVDGLLSAYDLEAINLILDCNIRIQKSKIDYRWQYNYNEDCSSDVIYHNDGTNQFLGFVNGSGSEMSEIELNVDFFLDNKERRTFDVEIKTVYGSFSVQVFKNFDDEEWGENTFHYLADRVMCLLDILCKYKPVLRQEYARLTISSALIGEDFIYGKVPKVVGVSSFAETKFCNEWSFGHCHILIPYKNENISTFYKVSEFLNQL